MGSRTNNRSAHFATRSQRPRSDGEGIGGGVYNLGLFDFDEFTLIFANKASTSHDDVFDLEV